MLLKLILKRFIEMKCHIGTYVVKELLSWLPMFQLCLMLGISIYKGYSNFWNENAIYIIEWSENAYFMSGEAVHFLASRDKIKGIFIPKIWIFFLLYTI